MKPWVQALFVFIVDVAIAWVWYRIGYDEAQLRNSTMSKSHGNKSEKN